ncbi:MAG: efflux RND transporter permease subunit [Calditrichia bacterium]
MKITKASLKYKTSVFVMLFILMVAGFMSYVFLPVESFPEVKQPLVFIAAPYVGVSPADLENLVVQPIEEKLEELSSVKKLTSTSSEGYAGIRAEFESDIDVDEAVRKVREKVDQAKPDLPGDLEDPLIEEMSTESIPIINVILFGDESLVRLKQYAEDLEDRFEQIPGILEINVTGGLERELKVDIDPSRLQYYNIGLEDVNNAIRDENLTIPGGSVNSGSLKWTVRVPGEIEEVSELANIVVKSKDGSPVYLRDLGEVYFGFKEQESFARINSKPSVTISVSKRTGENIIQIIDRVKQIVNERSETFPRTISYEYVGDQSIDIRQMVNSLENNIIAGMLLVIFVLYFFMGLRNGLLVGVAIPISMLVSFSIISAMGYTLNMMVLFSLILALGMLVDNAVVIVENIYRQHEEGKPLAKAAYDGTAEVGTAVVVSTATTLMAFLPLLFWKGMVGEFMRLLPMTLVVTLSASLIVGLIFNPVLASRFLRRLKPGTNLRGDRLLSWLTPRYENTLNWCLATFWNRMKVLGITLCLFVSMIFIFVINSVGVEFFPDISPRIIMVESEAPLGTRLERSDAIMKKIEERIANTTDMKAYVASVGQTNDPTGMSGNSVASHRGQINIDLEMMKERGQDSWLTMAQVTEAVQGIPGATIDVSKPADGPPTGKAVDIQLQGEDFHVLADLSEKIMDEIRNIEGISKLKDNYDKGKPELSVRVDREKAALFGLTTAQIANTVRTAINGTEVSDYRIGTDEYDITVRFSENYRENYSDLLNLTVFHEGVHYPLANFASIEFATGLSSISHVEGERVLSVTADVVGRNGPDVVTEVKEKLADFAMPEGYLMTFAGQDEEQQKTMIFLFQAFLITIGLIFFLLVTQFNSVSLPFVIMLTVVLSFFGVFFGLFVTRMPFGILMTGIGVISLAGIVVNNAIVLLDYIQKLRARGLKKMDAIIQGGKTRLRPVLLTAITTILGLIPLSTGINIDFIGLLTFEINPAQFITFGDESAQWWAGMGIVVIFGLLFATALTLVVVPVTYYLFSKDDNALAEERRLAEAEEDWNDESVAPQST